MANIVKLRHPGYKKQLPNWTKWRLTYEGGQQFLNTFLVKFSKRENNKDFQARKNLTYVPAFAKAAINDIKNAIFQRATDVIRKDGAISYRSATTGGMGGVDLKGSTMDAFIGQEVLGELLSMSAVGVYVDMPEDIGTTKSEKGNKHPYLYTYQIEDILDYTIDANYEFTNLLLRGHDFIYDEQYNLPTDLAIEYRYFALIDEGVEVTFYDIDGKIIGERFLAIKKIPFVIFAITDSLLADAANYQISHLNLASSDTYYAWKSNYPFYTEQFDARLEAQNFLRKSAEGTEGDGTEAEGELAKRPEIDLGAGSARRYPQNVDRPGFINPSPDPLRVSMEKQDKMKEEVRQLINLSLAGIKAKMVSSESRKIENEGLEAGLANIGLVLEAGERRIAELWHLYEGETDDTIIRYPEHYQLKSDEARMADAEKKSEFLMKIPSITFQKSLSKEIADLILGHRITAETLDKIYKEIDNAKVITTEPQMVLDAKELGLVSDGLAAKMLGLPESDIKQAQEDHAARLARVAIAQSEGAAAARGLDSTDPQTAKGEKTISQNPDNKE